jgi:hypothetical protein
MVGQHKQRTQFKMSVPTLIVMEAERKLDPEGMVVQIHT